ncbi:MAG: NADH-quinone oxidoreductase subunit C [Adlercreutzia sp.]|nr:NADH-quinone oxidoreductase subunit C [Adlercreutzia sp.]
MATFSQDFKDLAFEDIHASAAERQAAGWRYVQILAVNTENGVDLVYSYMLDGVLDNLVVRGVTAEQVVPSITDVYLEAFVCENEIHDLYGLNIAGIAIDFGGNFYQLAEKAPMTVISPAQLAAREKAKKAAEAPAAAPVIDEAAIQAKIAGLDPEKAAKVRAAMEAKMKKAAAEAAPAAPVIDEAAIEAKIAGLDPEKAAKVRAAMEAKMKKAAEAAANAEGEGE